MDTKRLLGASAAGLTALVLIWDEAPIAYSAGEQPRVMYSDRATEPGAQAHGQGDAAARGDRTVRARRRGRSTSTDERPAAPATDDVRPATPAHDVAH